MEIDAGKNEEIRCPYCNTTDSCDHLLLIVDTTFRDASGGLLYNAFNSRWSDLLEENGDDADERELFDELLAEVASLADAEETASFEGGPGMSSDYAYYFCNSRENALAATATFSKP